MFSRSTEYALRAIIYLARESSQEQKIGIAELAEAIDSPRSFTAKIMQKLTKNNALVSSATGPGGGFFLSPQARKKSLLYVLELLDEEVVISGCVLGLKECSETNPCPLHAQYKNIKPQLMHLFSHKTIGEVAAEMKDTRLVIQNVEDGKTKRKHRSA